MDLPVHDLPDELASIVDFYDVPAILLSRDYRILAANTAYRDLHAVPIRLGVSRCHAVSHHYERPCDLEGEACPLRMCTESGQPSRVLHVHHTRHGPEHVDVLLNPIRDAEGRVRAFIEVMTPVAIADAHDAGPRLIGHSRAFNRTIGLVQRAAPSDVPVLLLGETGTGKEMVARAVHEASARRNGPFVPVECSGLTNSLFESELFGHVRGAFTGADRDTPGLVESATGGTLFLDEIGDIPMPLQVKLLRLLESRTYRKVGAVDPRPADFRLVCATLHDLDDMVARGRFRADLYYRINTFPIDLPPLRERRDDIPLLVDAFLRRHARGKRLDEAALAWLVAHPLPGNVRQLRNLIHAAALRCDGDVITPRHLVPDRELAAPAASAEHASVESDDADPFRVDRVAPLDDVERAYLSWAQRRLDGDRPALARALGLTERTLYRRLARARDGS